MNINSRHKWMAIAIPGLLLQLGCQTFGRFSGKDPAGSVASISSAAATAARFCRSFSTRSQARKRKLMQKGNGVASN